VKRLIIATALLAVLAAPASAQRKPYSVMSDEEKAQEKVKESVDKQYQSVIERTRKDTAEVQTDPWANMRGTTPEQPKKKN
jgi:RecA-family ATPase